MKALLLFFQLLSCPILLAIGPITGGSTIDPADQYAYGANIGWIGFRGDSTNGAVVSEYVLSGYVHAANVGWIHLGDGVPGDHPTVPGTAYYANTSATDFGVNVQPAAGTAKANLRGYAYGANIGWINFESIGNPQVDLLTGAFGGFAWSANCGWINLGPFVGAVVTNTIRGGTDSDADGIADSFELFFAGNLLTMNAGTDADGDGLRDAGEYAADTDPFDSAVGFKITGFSIDPTTTSASLTWTSRPTRAYRIEKNDDLNTPWELGEGYISATGTFTSFTLLDSAADARFFRVLAVRPLAP